MAIVLSTPPYQQFYDSDGNPLSGGLIYTYAANTTTPQATYTDQGGGTQCANPIVLDSAGRAEFWLDNSLSYKFVIKTSGGSTIKTIDTVIPFAGSSGTVSASDGTISAPSIRFTNDTDTGFYRVGANAFSAVNNSGTECWQVNANGQFAVRDGSAATPSLSFLNDLDNGLYRIGANNWGLSANGALALSIVGVSSAVNYIELTNNSTTNPPYFSAKGSDTNIDARFEAKGTGTLRSESSYTNTTASAANVFINSSGQFLRSTSSLRYKTNVTNYGRGLDDLLKLRPVSYKGKDQRDGDTVFAGLIAEEVDSAGLTEYVVYDEDGRPDALHYSQMVALLINAIKELNAKIEAK